jgi:hypothetical protein
VKKITKVFFGLTTGLIVFIVITIWAWFKMPDARSHIIYKNPDSPHLKVASVEEYGRDSIVYLYVLDSVVNEGKPISIGHLEDGGDFDADGMIWSRDGHLFAARSNGRFRFAYDFLKQVKVEPKAKFVENKYRVSINIPTIDEQHEFILAQMKFHGGPGKAAVPVRGQVGFRESLQYEAGR